MFWGSNRSFGSLPTGWVKGSLVRLVSAPSGWYSGMSVIRATGAVTRNMLVSMIFGMAFVMWAIGPAQVRVLADETVLLVQAAIEKERKMLQAERAGSRQEMQEKRPANVTTQEKRKEKNTAQRGRDISGQSALIGLEAELEAALQVLVDALARPDSSEAFQDKIRQGSQHKADARQKTFSGGEENE